MFRHLPHGQTVSATGSVFQLSTRAIASGDDDKGLTDRRAAVALSLLGADMETEELDFPLILGGVDQPDEALSNV